MVWFWTWLGLVEATEVRVATLNIGHGRGDSRHQVLQSTEQIQHNLARVSELIQRERIDVLALQEVDQQAWWSGNRSQSKILGDELQFEHRFQGMHSQKSRLQYGTSILTSFEMLTQESSVHRSTFPLPSKGYTSAVLNVENQRLMVISLHLDPIRPMHRLKQIESLQLHLSDAQVPYVILGDFNIEWGEELSRFCTMLNVQAHEPHENWVTFTKLQRRLDWILISNGLNVVEYRTLETDISDHRPVIATIELVGEPKMITPFQVR